MMMSSPFKVVLILSEIYRFMCISLFFIGYQNINETEHDRISKLIWKVRIKNSCSIKI
jgi:hypothetical protein